MKKIKIIVSCAIAAVVIFVVAAAFSANAVGNYKYAQTANINKYGFKVKDSTENRLLYNIGTGTCEDLLYFSQNNIDLNPIAEPLQNLMNKVDEYKMSNFDGICGNATLYSIRMKFGESLLTIVIYSYYSLDCTVNIYYSEDENVPLNQRVDYWFYKVPYYTEIQPITDYCNTYIEGVNIFGYDASEASKIDVYYDNGVAETSGHVASAVFNADLSPIADDMNCLMNQADGLYRINDNAGCAADTEKFTVKMRYGDACFSLVIYTASGLELYAKPMSEGRHYFYFEQVNDVNSVTAFRKYYWFTNSDYPAELERIIQYLDTLVQAQ